MRRQSNGRLQEVQVDSLHASGALRNHDSPRGIHSRELRLVSRTNRVHLHLLHTIASILVHIPSPERRDIAAPQRGRPPPATESVTTADTVTDYKQGAQTRHVIGMYGVKSFRRCAS